MLEKRSRERYIKHISVMGSIYRWLYLLGEGGDAAWRFFWENEEEDQFQGIGAELVMGGRERAEWWLELGTIPSDPRLWHRPVWTLRN